MTNAEWLLRVLSIAPIAFVDDINISSVGSSQSITSNTLAEQFQKSKKLQLNVSENVWCCNTDP